MALSDLTERSAVLQAIAEFDVLGRQGFLKKYGFSRARNFYLKEAGKLYDSKAIVGAAHYYQHPEIGPLHAADFSGGDATVRRKLEDLGFTVKVIGADDEERASEHLVTGRTYTRVELKKQFALRDATINTGVFRPKGFNSVWLFVTEEKTSDRTQYRDFLDGDVLHWEGQTSGRTDATIIEHRRRGLELLLFYRKNKKEYPGAGFRYEGPFEYVVHEGSQPTSFVLRRDQISIEQAIEDQLEQSGSFSPSDVTDARQRIMAAIVRRRGQRVFRDALMQAYDGRCAVTGCDVREILEAAHIYPYRGDSTDHVTNGLLLRSDLHTLFDCGLVAVDEVSFNVLVAGSLDGSEYETRRGQALRLPKNHSARPNRDALRLHREQSGL